MNPKLCLMCKEKEIEKWESACSSCWKILEELDDCLGLQGKMVSNMIILNDVREFLRECGFDPFEGILF